MVNRTKTICLVAFGAGLRSRWQNRIRLTVLCPKLKQSLWRIRKNTSRMYLRGMLDFQSLFFLSYVAAVLLAILGMFIFFAVDGKASLLGILFLFVPFSVYYDLSDSKNCVCEIKWYKDKFVICTRSDEFTFTFDKDELYKIENDAFGGKIFVFRKDKQCFYVNERIFPEVVDAMQKIYCE